MELHVYALYVSMYRVIKNLKSFLPTSDNATFVFLLVFRNEDSSFMCRLLCSVVVDNVICTTDLRPGTARALRWRLSTAGSENLTETICCDKERCASA